MLTLRSLPALPAASMLHRLLQGQAYHDSSCCCCHHPHGLPPLFAVGEHAKNARGKGGQKKSPCCVLWADETRVLSHEKMRQGPTPCHANTSLEGIQKQNHVAKPCGQKIQKIQETTPHGQKDMLTWPKDMQGARVRATK